MHVYHQKDCFRVVREPYDQQIACHAEAWRRFAERQSPMLREHVAELAIRAACFTLRHRCHDLAIPFQLAAAARYQEQLWKLCNQNLDFGTRLSIHSEGLLIEVLHGEDTIGMVPKEHVSWIKPLLTLGADLRLVLVSGCETDDVPLEAFVMLTRTGQALKKVEIATGNGKRSRKAPVQKVSEPVIIRLWRDEEGNAQTNVPHAAPESVQGHEWGYGGSGPAELAHSILEQFVSQEEAWSLHGAFKDSVLDPMPWEGGEITSDRVRRWIEEEREIRRCC